MSAIGSGCRLYYIEPGSALTAASPHLWDDVHYKLDLGSGTSSSVMPSLLAYTTPQCRYSEVSGEWGESKGIVLCMLVSECYIFAKH
jgi:hypothetical protein